MKLLIAAGDTVSERSALPIGVRALVDAASEVRVLSPSLTPRLQWLAGDTSRAHQVADARLQTILGQLEADGISASGGRGDDLPRTAFADAVREFEPDHILVAVRAPATRGWQENDLIRHLVDTYRLPVTVFVVPA